MLGAIKKLKLPDLFLSYQRDWIGDRSGVKVYEKSRCIGITRAEAFDCALTASIAGRGGMEWRAAQSC